MRTETTKTYIAANGSRHATAGDAKRSDLREHLRRLSLRANSVDRLIEAIVEDRRLAIAILPPQDRPREAA